MDVLPVLDLLNSIVVRGIAGRRTEYQPIRSLLTDSHRPMDVARAIRARFGFDRYYVADLDAIVQRRPNWDTYDQLLDDGFRLMVDAGIERVSDAMRICRCGAEPIVGLESCAGPQHLAELVSGTDGQLTFSLDLLAGQPQFARGMQGWDARPIRIARQAVQAGVTKMIVLDLADVGTSSGGQTDALCRSLREEFPQVHLIGGGGVRGLDDLRRWMRLGAGGVLVASALHDERLTPAQIRSLSDDVAL